MKAVTNQQNCRSGQGECSNRGFENAGIRLRVTGFAGQGDCIEEMPDAETFKNGIGAAVEIRNESKLEAQSLEFVQNLECLGKQHPSLRVAERVIDPLEKLIEILDHPNFREDAAHDVFPPSFFVVN